MCIIATSFFVTKRIIELFGLRSSRITSQLKVQNLMAIKENDIIDSQSAFIQVFNSVHDYLLCGCVQLESVLNELRTSFE